MNSRKSSHEPSGMWRRLTIVCLLPIACCVLAACTSQTTGPDGKYATSRPGDGLENDPLGYNPKISEMNIRGGGIGNYDKNAMDKDLHDVLDP
jgi:hypothetical protein